MHLYVAVSFVVNNVTVTQLSSATPVICKVNFKAPDGSKLLAKSSLKQKFGTN